VVSAIVLTDALGPRERLCSRRQRGKVRKVRTETGRPRCAKELRQVGNPAASTAISLRWAGARELSGRPVPDWMEACFSGRGSTRPRGLPGCVAVPFVVKQQSRMSGRTYTLVAELPRIRCSPGPERSHGCGACWWPCADVGLVVIADQSLTGPVV